MMLLRVRSLALGLLRGAAAGRPGAGRPAQPRHHAVGARARLARRVRRPGPAGPLRAGAAGRGLGARQGRRPDAGGRGAARRRAARRSSWPPRRAWRSSTAPTACSACCCWPSTTPRHLFTMADVTAALSIEAMLGSDRPFLPELHAIRPHPGQAVSAANIYRLLQDSADHGLAPRRPRPTRCRTRTRCAARRRWPARPGTRWTSPTRSPAGAGVRRGQSGGAARRAGAVDRQLPRRAARLRRRLPGHRRRRGRGDLRTAGRPAARRLPLPRPAGVPDPRPGRQLRADDRPVHGGRDRGREPPARRARRRSTRCRPRACRRTTSRWAGRRPASCATSWTT